jgi:hypothetical protein
VLKPVWTNKIYACIDQSNIPAISLQTLILIDKNRLIHHKSYATENQTGLLLLANQHCMPCFRACMKDGRTCSTGGEGAIDHFSLNAAKNYFKKFDASFKGYDILSAFLL